jgi:hypothetical protein
MKTLVLSLLILSACCSPLQASDGILEKPVHFKPGSQGATLSGRLAGRDGVDYVLGARAGQRMRVRLHADNPQLYFNVLPPGSEEALFIGSTSGDRFEGDLPRSGNYRIRVYLMRAAARRDESASYRLDVSIEGASRPSPAAVGEDFADGYSGGPDYWQVTGLRRGDTLNVRRGPASGEPVVDELDEGDVVRNLGCKPVAGQRWCRVARPDDSRAQGWVAGRYLRESSYQP